MRRMPVHKVGVLALVTISVLSFFGLTRLNPFSNPYEMHAEFRDTGNLAPRSPVRIAGIDVGKVRKVEPIAGDRARVTMELERRALPIHTDAELKVRPRIFFEGNFFVDLQPGTPAGGELADGGTIPASQTSRLVSVSDVLATLRSDTREDLQRLVKEYAAALERGGAEGLRDALPHLAPALRDLSLTTDAARGTRPGQDVRRGLRGTQRTVAALDRDEQALQGLVTSLAATSRALADEDDALAASLPALRDLLRTGHPALGSLNAALPSVRTLAREALPGVRAAGPAVRAALPLLRQARRLVGRDELRGTTRVLRRRLPGLVRLVRRTVPLLEQTRAASACTAEVLVPFLQKDMKDPDFPANRGTVNQKLQRSFVGLAGESRTVDGNQSYFHSSFVPPPPTYRPAPPPDMGRKAPPRRPDVPCETQEVPNLEAPAAVSATNGSLVPLLPGLPLPVTAASDATRRKALLEAKPLVEKWQRRLQRRGARALRKEAGR